jgi:hypothetical protein
MIKSRMMIWAGNISCMGEQCIQAFSWKTWRKKATRRPRWTWKANIKINLREMKWGRYGWIHLAQDRDQWWALVNMVGNIQI